MPKITTKLWKYCHNKESNKDYYAISIPPRFVKKFLGKDIFISCEGNKFIIGEVVSKKKIKELKEKLLKCYKPDHHDKMKEYMKVYNKEYYNKKKGL